MGNQSRDSEVGHFRTQVLLAEDLRKFYGPRLALQGLSFSLEAGRILGFLGPNGAGKTTSIRILTTILEPDGGHFAVDGISCEYPQEIRRRIGVLPVSMRRFWLLVGLVCLGASSALAQDPVKVDPKHYKVEVENAQVRVLRIHYGPHEKSVMHGHPAGVAVFLTDSHGKFIFPDGNSEVRDSKAGQARWTPGEIHLPENLSDKPEELILVELKGKPATSFQQRHRRWWPGVGKRP